jgi:hypothetical protein
VNYLQIIRDKLVAAQALPVYAMAAPQGTKVDHIVLQMDSIDVTETKDGYRMQNINAELYIYQASADNAQTTLQTIRTYLAANGNSAYISAWMTNAQSLFNQDEETVLLIADFTFTIKTTY